MSKSLKDIEGIGEVYSGKLEAAGVTNQKTLLERGATPSGRKELAEASGCGSTQLLNWINRADLARVNGIGEEYADLLEAAGVDTVPELAQRNAANLTAKLAEVNESKKLVRALPSEETITEWIEQAGKLPRVLEY